MRTLARLGSCAALAAAGYALLSRSTFAARLRDDVPALVPGLTGPESVALALGLMLGFLPMWSERQRLPLYLVAAFLLSGIGAYGWTGVPWDELITEGNFNVAGAPLLRHFALVSLPAALVGAELALARTSGMLDDQLARGADRPEALAAARASRAGALAFTLACMALASVLWLFLSRL